MSGCINVEPDAGAPDTYKLLFYNRLQSPDDANAVYAAFRGVSTTLSSLNQTYDSMMLSKATEEQKQAENRRNRLLQQQQQHDTESKQKLQEMQAAATLQQEQFKRELAALGDDDE